MSHASTRPDPWWGVETNVRIGRVLTCILTEHLCPAKGWRVATLDRNQPDRVVVTLVATSATAICAGCGERNTRLHDVKPVREWRHLDCFGILTVIRAPVRRFKCRRCGIRVERVPWARPRSRFTHDFEAEVLRRARDTSILGVCRQLRLHWTSVMRLIEQWVSECAYQHFRRPLRVLGIDEVSYGRGQQKFLTIVWDHQRSRIVWIGKGRDRDTLGGFFAKLGHRRAHRLAAVTMDMAKGYIIHGLQWNIHCGLHMTVIIFKFFPHINNNKSIVIVHVHFEFVGFHIDN